jgi:hypothetical protein
LENNFVIIFLRNQLKSGNPAVARFPELGLNPRLRQTNSNHPDVMAEQGTSVSYLLTRLKNEGHSDLAEAVESGRLSAFAAGEAAGYLKRPQVLGTGSKNQARKRQHQLRAATGGHLHASRMMELWLGPNWSQGSLFSSREELVAAWEENRDEAMRQWGSHGRRPMAWWEFESGDLKHPGYFRERSTLWRAGVLTPAERAGVEHEWRQDFDAVRGQDARTRREHYDHCDIPFELVAQWSRRKRPRNLRKEDDAAWIPQPGNPSE